MNIALILSGGTGVRLGGDIPKQYIEIKEKPMIAYALEVLEAHKQIEKIQIVADGQWHELISIYTGEKFAGFSRPGENRQLSVLNGLKDILKYAVPTDNVIIHDAARPLVKAAMFTKIIEELEQHEAVTPIIPVKDTVYLCGDHGFSGVLRRTEIAAGQTPEGFRLGKYYQANMSLIPEKILKVTGSLEVALLAKMDAVPIQGDEKNIKVTTIQDLNIVRNTIGA